MEPEDEAFEELALKQGSWQYTSGWRKKQIVETGMTDKKLFKLALEALKEAQTNNDGMEKWDRNKKAIIALEEALAQPEQEPVCPECKAVVLYECVACSSNNYPPKETT
jgi:hypothetical protein